MMHMEKLGSSTSSNHSHAGAEYTRSDYVSVPAHYGAPAAEYAALKKSVAVTKRPSTVLRLTGKDPTGMLDAILTNEVPKEADFGAYALLLSPKGRVQADLRVLKSGGEVLIITEPEGAEAAKEILGRYAPFSRVKLDEPEGWGVLGLYGPQAPELLGGLELEEYESSVVEVGGVTALAAGVRHPIPSYDLVGPTDLVQKAREHLVAEGAVPAGSHAYETVRIETLTPRFGADITTENFPAEAGILDRAVSFAKGCYPGQETVARMYYRGHPNRTLYRLRIEGTPPPPGTPIFQNKKQVGKITSVAPLQVDGENLVLGYLHRNAEPGSDLRADESNVLLLD